MSLIRATPQEFGLRVRQHPAELEITSANKMRSGTQMQVSFADTLVESVFFLKKGAEPSEPPGGGDVLRQAREANAAAKEAPLLTAWTRCGREGSRGFPESLPAGQGRAQLSRQPDGASDGVHRGADEGRRAGRSGPSFSSTTRRTGATPRRATTSAVASSSGSASGTTPFRTRPLPTTGSSRITGSLQTTSGSTSTMVRSNRRWSTRGNLWEKSTKKNKGEKAPDKPTGKGARNARPARRDCCWSAPIAPDLTSRKPDDPVYTAFAISFPASRSGDGRDLHGEQRLLR